MNRTDVAAVGLLCIGLTQMAGDLAEIRALKGLGAASCAAPLPKVFTAVRGMEIYSTRFETYSTRFFLEWEDRSGKAHSMELTSEIYGRLKGPYNRRNVYGAVLAYGPVMPKGLREPVARFGLCGKAPVLRELGIDPADLGGPIRVRYEPVAGATMDARIPRILEAPCR